MQLTDVSFASLGYDSSKGTAAECVGRIKLAFRTARQQMPHV